MTLRRTRIGSIPDMLRISAAVQRPGIDPRIWCSLAYAADESMLDAEHGDFVDVVLLPSELEVTVRVPQEYAGAGFGSNEGRIHKDDELVVLFPDGDPAQGGVVVARLWSASDKPPDLATANPKDVSRQLEKDLSHRLKLTGAGKWLFEGDDELHFKNAKKAVHETQTFVAKTANVRLGGEDAGQQLINGNLYRTAEAAKHATEQGGLATEMAGAALLSAAGAQLAAAGAMMVIPVAGAIMAGPIIAAAGAQITGGATSLTGGLTTVNGAITSMEAQSTTFLSNVSKTNP